MEIQEYLPILMVNLFSDNLGLEVYIYSGSYILQLKPSFMFACSRTIHA